MKYIQIEEIEEILDKVNGDFGSKECYCLFCKSKEYNSQVGIVHIEDCVLSRLRREIREQSLECEYLYADWCHHPDDEEQEQCRFYFYNYMCPSFKPKKNELLKNGINYNL